MASRSNERRASMMRTQRAGTPRDGRADLVSDALRQLWANAESDPVPDDFLALLDRLDSVRAHGAENASQAPGPHVDGDDAAA